MSDRPLPLAGVQVLSAEQYGATPYGTMFLAQLGAEVIKIEPPGKNGHRGGDTARAVGPHFLRDGESLFFQSFNLNKRSMTLDLRSKAGQQLFHRLVEKADAVANNMRGDLAETMGLTYQALSKVNPAIVCAHVSAYGRDNERARWPGYDYLAQAEAGFMAMTGEPDAEPTRFGLSMVDFMTGSMMATGLLAALLDARKTGRGRDIDVDLLSAAVHQTSYPAIWYMNAGDVTPRMPRSGHPSVVPSQMFRTEDGFIFVMAQLPKFWTILCERIGHPELAADPRFHTPADRHHHRQLLTGLLEGIFVTRPTAHWLGLLQGHMPVAPVYGLAQALDSPWLREIGMVEEIAYPERSLRVLSSPIKVDGRRLPNEPAPYLGADTEAVLLEAGLSDAEIAALRQQGVI